MFSEGGYALSRSQNDKTSDSLRSCFRHHDIRAKTRSTMTTATTFSRQRHWLTHIHHLELRTSRTRSRTRLRI